MFIKHRTTELIDTLQQLKRRVDAGESLF